MILRPSNFAELDALGPADLICRRAVALIEVLDAAIGRIEQLVSNEALQLGALDPLPDDPLAGGGRDRESTPFGQPAMSVPPVITRAGLPLGVHFSAPFGNEATLSSLAGQLEVACPWRHRGFAEPMGDPRSP